MGAQLLLEMRARRSLRAFSISFMYSSSTTGPSIVSSLLVVCFNELYIYIHIHIHSYSRRWGVGAGWWKLERNGIRGKGKTGGVRTYICFSARPPEVDTSKAVWPQNNPTKNKKFCGGSLKQLPGLDLLDTDIENKGLIPYGFI